MDKQIEQPVNYKAMDAGDFLAAVGMDAKLWADAFEQVNPPTDHGTMLGWFANAIMAGYDEARRRYETPTPPAGQVDAVARAIEKALHYSHGFTSSQPMTEAAEAALKASGAEHIAGLVAALWKIAMSTTIAYGQEIATDEANIAMDALKALPPELRGK